MLFYLFEYLDSIGFPGAGVFQYISFRAASAVITSLIISMLLGKNIINVLRKKQIGESIRDLGLEGQIQKQGTPTMGGVIILASILIPILLFGDLEIVDEIFSESFTYRHDPSSSGDNKFSRGVERVNSDDTGKPAHGRQPPAEY